MPVGQPLSLDCTVDRPWQYCGWAKEGAERAQLCNAASSERGTPRNCTVDGRIKMTMTNTSCGFTMDNATMEDEGEFSCVFFYSLDNPPMVSQTMRVVVATELEIVRREKAELEREITELETALRRCVSSETGKTPQFYTPSIVAMGG